MPQKILDVFDRHPLLATSRSSPGRPGCPASCRLIPSGWPPPPTSDGDLAGLPALVAEVEELLLVALVQVPKAELGDGGRIDERRDDGTVPEADDISYIDGSQERPGLLVADLRGLPLEDLIALGFGNRRGRRRPP